MSRTLKFIGITSFLFVLVFLLPKQVSAEVKKDAQTASIKIKVESPVLITSIITEEAVESLNLTAGDNARVIIKATEIMVDKRGA